MFITMYLFLKPFLNGCPWKYFLSSLLDLSATCVFFPSAQGKSGRAPPFPPPAPGPAVLSHVRAQDVVVAGETAEGKCSHSFWGLESLHKQTTK